MTQRWNAGRTTYRPKGEPIDPTHYAVAEIEESAAKVFVLTHHYSGTFPASCVRIGLFDRGELVGVAVFSQPASQAVLDVLPNGRAEGTELGRLVLLDRVPANGETWFLARAFAILRTRAGRRFTGVVSHADPVQRRAADGTIIMPGHVGTVYQALNGQFIGRTRKRTLWILPSGRVYNERSISKVKAQDRGWRYAADQLREAGAGPIGSDPAAWLVEWLPKIATPLPHKGVFKYVWWLDKRNAKALSRHLVGRGIPLDMPRPKEIDIAP